MGRHTRWGDETLKGQEKVVREDHVNRGTRGTRGMRRKGDSVDVLGGLGSNRSSSIFS